MKHIPLALCAVLAFSNTAAAEGFGGEIGYMAVSGDRDINLGAAYGFVGYSWDHSYGVASSAEVYALFGVQDDNVGLIEFSLEPTVGVAYKLGRQATEDWNLYVRALYARFGAEASSVFGGETSANETGFGIGMGATYKRVTFSYVTYVGDLSEFDTFNVGFKF